MLIVHSILNLNMNVHNIDREQQHINATHPGPYPRMRNARLVYRPPPPQTLGVPVECFWCCSFRCDCISSSRLSRPAAAAVNEITDPRFDIAMKDAL